MVHIHLTDVDSTQDVLKEQLSLSPAGESVLVSCENQVKGRGRGDHVWSPMPGSIYLSLSMPSHPVPSFTAIEVSVLCVRFFEHEGSRLLLKWPNDIYTDEQKKCGGILVQSNQQIMMSGIGINLFTDHPDYGGVYKSGFEFNKKSWSLELAKFIESNRYADSQSLINDWEARCLHMNEVIEIHEAGVVKRGIFMGLGSHGEALLRSGEEIMHLYNGSLKRIDPTYR